MNKKARFFTLTIANKPHTLTFALSYQFTLVFEIIVSLSKHTIGVIQPCVLILTS